MRTAPPPGLSFGCGGIGLCPAVVGIDNSLNYIYITSDATVKTMSAFAMERGHRHLPMITAAADGDPYVFYRNGYLLHMADALPSPAMAGARQLDSRRG
jgi:hypothetical protein